MVFVCEKCFFVLPYILIIPYSITENCIFVHSCIPLLVVTDLLTSTIKSYPHVILESMSRLREAFDYLTLLPLSTADGLLRSIQPLLKLSPTLRDGLVIVLRKAIFSRYTPTGFVVVCFQV